MKKLFLLMLSSLLLVNCTKHSFDGYNYVTKAKEDFTQKFVKTFGEPASDQDWGFDGVSIVDLTSKASTRGHNVNRNEWEGKFILPPNVTEAEENAVLAELRKSTVDRDKNLTINWTDFFVYQVHKGTDTYNTHENKSMDAVASDKMNHLQCGSGTVGADGKQSGFWEHINDFNNGSHTSSWGNIIGATLMVNSSSLNFAYHNATDSKYHDTYTVIDGATIGYDGFYYICFDFLANGDNEQPANKNMGVDRNYNYEDWIVRISPATFKAAKRIIAEDLAADESDFDYNDVVFDATLANEWLASENANKLVAHITLRAAGGTMPLYVADKEVHELFGVDTGTMVNTGRVSRPYVQFTAIIGEPDWNSTKSIKDITVRVLTNNGEITLQSNKGEASEKLCVDNTYVWCSERQPIQNKYPDFVRFVSDRNVKWYQVQ
jgi:hypothetical protein